jgi:hypothetical protein
MPALPYFYTVHAVPCTPKPISCMVQVKLSCLLLASYEAIDTDTLLRALLPGPQEPEPA